MLLAQVASAEVDRIEITRKDDMGTYERLIGRVYFSVDPNLRANRDIADLGLAPRNAQDRVEFSSDVLFFRPKQASKARGTVFLEIVNRGRDQSLAIMSGARQRDLSPASWDLGDRFLLEQGFTVAFLGWQFDVRPSEGLTFEAPVAPVDGLVRESYIKTENGMRAIRFFIRYCASPSTQQDASLSFRTRMEATPRVLSRESWQFAPDGCSVYLEVGPDRGLYEIVYHAKGSAIAGLGFAAIRDFASYLRYGPADATLREAPSSLQRIIGYGYSQSARFLREFVRDGFNADERGRIVFDGLIISSAGAGVGSFNHRFAVPGEAGNSVLSVLRPVDVPPFTDDGLLANARETRAIPKIFYTFSSTEYWARAASLTHTSVDGRSDIPLAPTSRLYFLAGTPHASGSLPTPTRRETQPFRFLPNFAEQRWVARALVLDLDAWVRNESAPPPSRYPSISQRELVPLEEVGFPKSPSISLPSYMPQVWRMDFGAMFSTTRVITKEPPLLGEPYPVRVPQVDADGNDLGGVGLPEVAVPLGTYTGWNVSVPQLSELGYLSGLVGSFQPFALTREDRERDGDSRRSIAERYTSREDYLDRVRQASEELVRQRFMLTADIPAVLKRAEDIWNAVVTRATQAR